MKTPLPAMVNPGPVHLESFPELRFRRNHLMSKAPANKICVTLRIFATSPFSGWHY